MREFNKLFIVALPRCATVSMSQAVGMLGIPTAHLGKIYGEPGSGHSHPARLERMLQQIEAGDYQLEVLGQCRGLADYPACCLSVIQRLDQQYPGSLFINVGRQHSIQRWLQSVESQFVGLELLNAGREALPEEKRFVEVMRRFRVMTFGAESFDAQVYAKAYDQYQLAIQDYFAGSSNLLNIADASELATSGMQRLCQFLEITGSSHYCSLTFPYSNEHSSKPRAAFLSALRQGKVISQTGITS